MKTSIYLILACLLLCGAANAAPISLIDNDPNNGNGSLEFGTAPVGDNTVDRIAGTSSTFVLPGWGGWTAVTVGWGGFWNRGATYCSEGTAYGVTNSAAKVTYTSDPIPFAAEPGDTFTATFKMNNNTVNGSCLFSATLILDPGASETRVPLGSFSKTFAAANTYEGSGDLSAAISISASVVALEVVVNNSAGGNDQVGLDEVSLTVVEGIPPVDIGDAGLYLDWSETWNGAFEYNDASKNTDNGWDEANKRFLMTLEGVTDSDGNGKIDIVLPGGWKLESQTGGLTNGLSMGFAASQAGEYSGDLDGDGRDFAMFVNAYDPIAELTNNALGYTAVEGEGIMVTCGLGANGSKIILTPYLTIGVADVQIADKVEQLTESFTRHDFTYVFSAADAGKAVGLKFVLDTAGDTQGYIDGVQVRFFRQAVLNENGGTATGEATFDVSLLVNPGQNVDVDVVVQSDDNPELTGISVTDLLSFTTANYMTPQPVDMAAVDNSTIEGDRTYWITITDPNEAAEPNIVPSMELARVIILDDDLPRIDLVDADALQVAEGGIGGNSADATFTVKLNGYPTQPVTVSITDGNDPDEVTFSDGGVLVFTVGEYEKPVTITAIDTDDTENVSHGTTLSFASISGDTAFNALTASVGVTVLENDCDAIGFVKDKADLSGPAGTPDCVINLYDFAEMASQWLDCTFPNLEGCPE